MGIIKCDLHVHTLASGHAFNTVDECCQFAFDNGYELIGISDHGPSMERAPHTGYFEMLYRLPRINKGIATIYGCEANIIDESGLLDLPVSVLNKLDYTMAGLHKRVPYHGTTKVENTRAIINAITNGFVDIVTHPVSWNFDVDIYDIVAAASLHGVVLEANRTVLVEALERDMSIVKQYRELLRESRNEGVSIILGSDAHHVSEMFHSDDEIEKLSMIYDFDFSMSLNTRVPELITLLHTRRGK